MKNIIHAPLEEIRFHKGKIPAIGIFDVLEHIEDDHLFIHKIQTLLKSNGKIYITVPAFGFLWSNQDIYAKHFRRYSVGSLTRLLRTNGFEIIYASYFFSFLFLPVFLLRSVPFFLKVARDYTPSQFKGEMTRSFGILTPIIQYIQTCELAFISNRKYIPFGSSILVCAQKAK